MTPEELEALVRMHISQLREHVDVVRIFVSLDPEDGKSNCRHLSCGSGNLFAQLGHVKDWIVAMDEEARQEVREKDQ